MYVGETITDALQQHAERAPRTQPADGRLEQYDQLEEELMRDQFGRCRRSSQPPPKPKTTK